MTDAPALRPVPVQAASSWQAWLPSLIVFQLVYLISYVDRQILSLVVGPVKASLRLDDVQIGLLQGFAFSMVMAVSAMVTASLVDTGNRVRLLGIAIICWCAMTIACGLAQDFWMLLFARSGLAIAEGVVPVAALSLLADIVPRTSLPRAGALLMLSPYLGSGAALLLGGPILVALQPYDGVQMPIVGTFEPWRGLFILLGAPGILLGAAILLFMAEPPRKKTDSTTPASKTSVIPFLKDNWRFLLTLMTFLTFLNTISQSIYSWTPTFMIRVYGYDPAQVGLVVGPIFVIAGTAGCLLGTYIMSAKAPETALTHVVRAMVRMMGLFTIPLLLFPLSPWPWLSLALLAVSLCLLASVASSTLTPATLFAPSEVRGRVIAVCALYSGGLGGMGPLFVGAITDWGFGSSARIDYALTISFAVVLVVAWMTGPRAAKMAARIDRSNAERSST